MATGSRWLLFTCLLGLCAAWMDERPVLESRDGNLFISAAKDRNITLKILGKGHVNLNEIDLLQVATAADSATRLIDRWKTGYLAEVETNLQRLSQIVEGPDGLERRIAMMKPFADGNTTIQPDNANRNQSTPVSALRFRMLSHRIRRVEDKVKSIEAKLQQNDCASNPCLHEGLCLDQYDGYRCKCPSTWEGPNCETDVNECVRLLGTDLGCQNGATCHNLEGSYRCDCLPGWFGLHCTKKNSICNTQNSEELCGHGVCVTKTGSPLGYTCICDQGWQSDGANPACVKDVDECTGNHRPCSVNPWVDCRNAPGTFFCDACPRGYTGNGYYCTDIDECQVDNGGCSTSPRVDCINTMGSRTCGACPTGYRGDGVTCVYVGGCAINNGGCHPLATCVQNEGLSSAYVICRCPAGMTGDGFGPSGCQSSPDGIFPNACRSNPCVHGRCIPADSRSSYTCVCNPGFSGPTCNVPTESCQPNPCKNSGVCLISNGAVTCNCPSTHTGSRCENPRQSCGGVSRNPVGHLKFPEGGNVYQHGLSCAWVLATNSSLVLNVTFTAFNLEQSTDCKYDFLQIHDGRNAASQMIGRFCGNTLPHVNGSIVSSHNSLYFWFHSDSSVNHDGFEFHWNSIEPVCGGQLNGEYGTISSPGSPGRYPPNRDCYWTIQVRPSKRIQIHFGQLSLEEHPTCEFDFLEISTVHDEQLARYCNHTQPPPLVVPSAWALVHFHSDSAGQDAGFQIHYSVIEGIPGCNDVYTTPTGIINSPVNVDRDLDLECEWKIQMPIGKRVRVTWTKFELDSGDRCATESVKIYDGDTSDSRLLQRYCGSNLPPAVRSTSNAMLIVFTSKKIKQGSFSLSYNILCGSVYTEESGIIHSSNYPFENTLNNPVCIYEIQQPPNRRIVLHLLDADIRGLHTSSCFPSSLRIYDGPNENSTMLAVLCGADVISDTDAMIYYSTFNTMFIKYTSMMYGNSKERGFLANYTTILSRCGGLYTETTGSIQMPQTGQIYAMNENCIWTIQAPTGYVIRLTWLSFDLEVNAKCRFDYVSVYENYMTPEKELIGKFCGKKNPPALLSQGNTMTLVFHSDATINREGFVATYLFLDETKICGGHFLKRTGVITSPNYPQQYPHRKECTWKIEAPNRQRIILNVTHFHLESHSSCIFDYLEIRNGGYETSPLIGKYCGTDIPTEIISQTNQLYLKFACDSSRSASGFRIEWDSTTSGCGGTLNAANGDIISPNYPQPYMHQAECYWKIAIAEGSLVQLIIMDLQLENHAQCNFDYIEIWEEGNYQNRQRYCDSPHQKILQMKSNLVNLQFRSDYTNSGRGFHLKYETLCRNKVHGFYGVIESPNFPNQYEHNMNCSWTIDMPIGNKINLTFSHFDLEGHGRRNACDYDYLQISEGSNDVPTTQLVKLCHSGELPAPIHSSNHQLFLTFVTDEMFAFNGFRAEWLLDGCGGHLTKPTGGFTSPGYPSDFPSYIQCEWLIEVDYGHSIELTIQDINTEMSRTCETDMLHLYSGENEQGEKLVDICYSERPVTYTSFGNKVFAKFKSQTSNGRGFNVTYRTIPAICGGRYTADTGVIFSTNYPKNYPHRQNCEWLLEVDTHYVVNISFLDFDIEFTGNCTHDYVNIYDGPTRNSPLLGSHCKDELPPSYVSTSNKMLVVMVTDSILSAKGFKARYSRACGARIVVKSNGFLTSIPSYSTSAVVESANCTWTLVAENPGDHVTLTFTNLVLPTPAGYLYAPMCDWNYVEVFEGASTDGPSRAKWCSSVVPLPITSTGDALTVCLQAKDITKARFSLTYSSLNSACGGTYASLDGKIGSPGYPNTYPLNVECVWTLTNTPGNTMTLTFSEFELQQSEHCDLDYLEIREVNGIGKLLGTFCGTNIEPVVSMQTLWIKFKSDGDDVGKGFVAEYHLTSGGELTGPTGRVTSPLYPTPFSAMDVQNGWRITVEFEWAIRIQINDMYIENYSDLFGSSLHVYDGYDFNAPILASLTGSEIPEAITTTSNVAYISLRGLESHRGNWFDLTWVQVRREDQEPEKTEEKLGDCNEIVSMTSSFVFTSPNYPAEYNSSLQCNWLFTSPPGTHLVLRIVEMDLEETSDCYADYVAIYNGDAMNPSGNPSLLQRLCLANSTSMTVVGSNLVTVKFVSDSYYEKAGFRAIMYKDCGGKLEGPNGVIDANNWTIARSILNWQVRCEWTIEVKRGRTIEAKIEDISIQEGPNSTCTDHYVLLKNGGDEMSPLLGTGKYCGQVAPAPLQTTGNRLYVKVYGMLSNYHFKLSYREVSLDCGGEFVLSSKQKEWQISTPNYPNIPPPFSECTWRVIAPAKERIVIHFVERFDLSNSVDCDKEFVEVRDGGTDRSKLFGRYCKNVAPSSMTSTGNMMYVHFYTDLPEPKNGFKAVFVIGEACGGMIRGSTGVISSPNYPFFYPKNQTCGWTVVAPKEHTIKFQFLDLDLPGLRRCKVTDHVTISDILTENDTRIDVGTYCGTALPDNVETMSNQAFVKFVSDNIQYTPYRGFNMKFEASREVCGGEFTAMQGIIKSNGYPNLATESRYCYWKIKLPWGFQVVADILDLDVASESEMRIGYPLLFFNDLNRWSKITMLAQNSTVRRVQSSSNTMVITSYSSRNHRGFKLRYSAVAPAPCGGELEDVSGNITAPKVAPFNESSYFCRWKIKAPSSMMNTENGTGLTLTLKATGMVGGIRSVFTNHCFNYQYIHLIDAGKICGNLTTPMYLRSPKPVNDLVILNGTYGKLANFNLEYQWQPCGGVLDGFSHVIQAPKNMSYPISCIWYNSYSNSKERVNISFTRFHLGSCDKNYILIRSGGSYSADTKKFCGNNRPSNISTSFYQLWIEYMASEEPNDFEVIVQPVNNGCGGNLRGSSRDISSPKFPSLYPNNAECTWVINADSGFHIGLVFVERFHLENSPNCKNDYVQVFDWIADEDKMEGGFWKELGKVCGRSTPEPFNSTSNRMKVTFRSNEAVQADGFRAVWNENCGGTFHASRHPKFVQSPSFPSFYPPRSFCNYTILAPDKNVIVEFMEFDLEYSRRDCPYDNLTTVVESRYGGTEEAVWCGITKPPATKSANKIDIIFQSDDHTEHNGFLFKYYLDECGGNLTKPGVIKPLMNGTEYYGDLHCLWYIEAPPDKNVVLRFESFEMEQSYRCIYDSVEVYNGATTEDENRLGTVCGNLSETLPVFRSTANSMAVRLNTDYSRHLNGFTAKVLFVKGATAGCGGDIDLNSSQSYSFRTQNTALYDQFEDCHWTVTTSPQNTIKFSINSMDVKNATNRQASNTSCTGDYLEVRDGYGPFSELLGKYCGNVVPQPIVSATNRMWIRFYSDGTLQGTGVSGTLELLKAPCTYAAPITNETAITLTTPNYPGGHQAGIKCRWTIQTQNANNEKIRVQFEDFDLIDSATCEDEYLEITDSMNRKFIEDGFGEDFIWNGESQQNYYTISDHMPSTTHRYCGSVLPHDYYSYSTMLDLTFRSSSHVGKKHRGFKLEYGNANCDRNYTSEQGRIVHESIQDCWITITAPENHTISLYFNQFMLYDPTQCTETFLQVFDGDFNGNLLATLCAMEIPSPIFSTGNKLSLHSRSEWHSTYEYYDITFTTTSAGRGCGGRIYNYAGALTSPMYPNEYRKNIECSWDLSVPRGLKLSLTFSMIDLGSKNLCRTTGNILQIFEMTESGNKILATTYCSEDDPAPFVASGNRVIVTYTSTINNGGTGWSATFKAVTE